MRYGESSRLCPTCGQHVPAEALFCPFDGRRLDEARADSKKDDLQRSRAGRTRARDSLVGRIVDERYEVLQLLGEGGMGSVYRVRHRVLGRLLAMKVLRPEYARDMALAERFVQEARAAAAISHPNVVSITDFGMIGRGQPYFVMELLEGRTLSSLMRERGALPPEFVVGVVRSVASALAAAHQVGVIHRDLKPDNIILSGDVSSTGTLKVLDFGLAKVLGASRLTQDDVVYGTPQYMSPEQASGEELDARVDVYALGILSYELLTGVVPFEADSYMGVLTQQIYAEPAPPSAHRAELLAHPKLESIVLACLRKRREERIGSMQELIQALDEVSSTLPVSNPVESHRRRTVSSIRPALDSRIVRRRRQRRRWWTYALLGGAVALAIALLLLYGRLSSENGAAKPSRSNVPVTGSPLRSQSRQDTNEPAIASRAERVRSAARHASASEYGKKGHPERVTDRGAAWRGIRTDSPRSSDTVVFERKDSSESSEIGNPWPQ